jgi:hypothetical protein
MQSFYNAFREYRVSESTVRQGGVFGFIKSFSFGSVIFRQALVK